MEGHHPRRGGSGGVRDGERRVKSARENKSARERERERDSYPQVYQKPGCSILSPVSFLMIYICIYLSHANPFLHPRDHFHFKIMLFDLFRSAPNVLLPPAVAAGTGS